MNQAFIIMQIGNAELDKLYKEVFLSALSECGFEAKRVDKHNEGKLLKSEIVRFIEQSDIMIADLTNERPNCYLEVGYAMGLDKFSNLILTAREDHYHDSPNYDPKGHKIHFDLSGYDILFWDPNKLEEAKEKLKNIINRRWAIISPQNKALPTTWDDEWIFKHRQQAFEGLKQSGNTVFMEICMRLLDTKISITQQDLLKAADDAQIRTSGWPIGIVFNNGDDVRPRPVADGIIAEIKKGIVGNSYDYWTLRKDGSYYLLKNMFEELKNKEAMFFDTRIIRIAEVLLFASRLYNGLKIPHDSKFVISIRQAGFKGKYIQAANPNRVFFNKYESKENEITVEVITSQSDIELHLVEKVNEFTQPLFALFDFYKVEKSILEDIVNKFVAGKVI